VGRRKPYQPQGGGQPNPVEEEAALSTIVRRRGDLKLQNNFKVINRNRKEPRIHPRTFTVALLTFYSHLISRWKHYYGHPIFSSVVFNIVM
jgi:hypothetical protein